MRKFLKKIQIKKNSDEEDSSEEDSSEENSDEKKYIKLPDYRRSYDLTHKKQWLVSRINPWSDEEILRFLMGVKTFYF